MKQLEADGSWEGKAHRKIARPWGNYTSIAESNRCKIPVDLIEMQSGEYLGEDDMVHFEDPNGRTTP